MHKLFFFLFLSLPFFLSAQSDLGSAIDEISGLISEVQVGKDYYEQDLNFNSAKAYLLEFTITETDSKGRTDSDSYSWNLSHIDPKLVRWEDSRDKITVVMSCGRKDYIRKYNEGEMQGFENEIVFLASDIDNARALVDKIKAAIPLAEAQWEKDSELPQDYEGLKSWVAKQVTSASFEDKKIDQSWKFESGHPSRLKFTQSEEGGKSGDETFMFNLADINPNDLKVQVRGEMVLLELSTKGNNRYIQVEENGQAGNYASDCQLAFAEIDEALVFSKALENLIKMAVEKQSALFPKATTVDQAMEGIKANLKEFSVDDTSYRPMFTEGCQAELTYITESERGTQDELFRFHWADLDPSGISIRVRGKELALEVKMKGRNDYVFVSENGEQQNYEDALTFPAPDLQTVKQLEHWVKSAIELCPEEAAPKDWAWVQQEIAAGAVSSAEVSQEADQLEGNSCKWAISILEEGKRSSEDRYEFNLYDINPKKVELKVSGKKVLINLETNDRAQIIQVYSNSEELSYEESFSFEVKDVATGKVMLATIKGMIEGCEQ